MNVTWSNSLGKVALFVYLDMVYGLYLGKVVESLTNKIQSFQIFINFWRFQVFALSYRANSKRRK